MLSNTYFWSAVGLLILFGILARFGVHTMVLNALDARGTKIAADLDEAKKLREDATKLLAEYEAKRKAAEAEADAIVAAAREEAERLAREAETKMVEFIARRTKTAEMKIAQAEMQAAADVRSAAADAAAKAAGDILRSQMTGQKSADLLARSLGDVKSRLN